MDHSFAASEQKVMERIERKKRPLPTAWCEEEIRNRRKLEACTGVQTFIRTAMARNPKSTPLCLNVVFVVCGALLQMVLLSYVVRIVCVVYYSVQGIVIVGYRRCVIEVVPKVRSYAKHVVCLSIEQGFCVCRRHLAVPTHDVRLFPR